MYNIKGCKTNLELILKYEKKLTDVPLSCLDKSFHNKCRRVCWEPKVLRLFERQKRLDWLHKS